MNFARPAALRGLLPPSVAVVETHGDVGEDCLFPGERVLLAGAVESRRREFATARWCARRALVELGQPAVAVLTGRHREPLWPDGIVGSLTHCAGYRAAAVARASDIAAVGIDVEPSDELPGQVLDVVTVREERVMLRRLSERQPDVAWGRLLFSAKEAVFKAWFPLEGSWLDFTQCRITIHDDGRFTGDVLVPHEAGTAWRRGRWAVAGGHLVTAVAVSAAQSPPDAPEVRLDEEAPRRTS